MKKALIVFLFPVLSYAQDVYQTQIIESKCEVVAKSGSATGAIVGSGVGAAAGSVIGGALFGKKHGRWIGGLAGGVAGGVAGENIGSTKTYSCMVKIQDGNKKEVWVETVGKQHTAGSFVTVYRTTTGLVLK